MSRLNFLSISVSFCIFLSYPVLLNAQHDMVSAQSKIQKEYCFDCHECSNPTAADPCLKRCPFTHTAKGVEKHSLKECPDMIIIDLLSDLYSPVVFAHRHHAEMSEIGEGCVVCHHYSPAGEMPPCRKCHGGTANPKNLRQPGLRGAYHRQCLNCHREWSHDTACEVCHTQKKKGVVKAELLDQTDIIGISHPKISATLKYVYQTRYTTDPIVTFHHTDHVDLFGLKCVNCHQGDNCGRCHDIGHRTRTKINHVKTCIACHNERNCSFCHSQVEKPPFDHAISIGWELGKHHQDMACQNCHGPAKEFVLPSRTCTSCHIHWEVGSFEHIVTGLILSEEHEEFDCYDCHVDENFETLPTCDNCHEDIAYPEFIPGKKTKG